MLAVEFGTGQVLWSILYLFLFVVWFWLIIVIFSDIMRSEDLSGWGKALWSIFIIFFFYIGVFAYLIVRGGGMSDRAAKSAQAQDAAMRSYIQQTAGAGVSPAEQVEKLSELHNQGKLSDEEFAAAKAKALS